MKKQIEKSIEIDAPKEKIWHTLFDDETYRQWVSVWSEGSRFIGDWSEGSEIRFVGPNKDGSESGMIARVVENRPFETLRLEHFGTIDKGQELFVSEWVPSREEYRISDGAQESTLQVLFEVPESYFDYFSETWDKALAMIKDLSES